MRFLSMLYLMLFFAAFAAACNDDKDNTSNSGTDGGIDGSTDGDTDGDGDADSGVDSGVDSGPDPSNVCEELGLPKISFVETASDKSLNAIAADFTIPTTDGNWNLKKNWSGCESYVFMQDAPRQVESSKFGYELWSDKTSKDWNDFFSRTPQNVHYFFMSDNSKADDVKTSITKLKEYIDVALAKLPPKDQNWWVDHLHYVNVTSTKINGWVGDIMKSPAWGFAIDRFQKIRYIGSYSDPNRYNSSVSDWPFGHNPSMIVNEPIYYNYEATREQEMICENDTVLTIFEDDNATEDDQYATVDFPDASTMAGFDTMMIDLTLGCIGNGELGDCPAWDYLVYLFLCDDKMKDSCNLEIGRWITTYHREGRWVHDVSALLPYFADGGTKYLRWNSSNDYELHMDIRLSNRGKTEKPTQIYPLFAGQHKLDATYNDNWDEITVNIPADAVKVELATVITGHGMAQPDNCAEFCNTDHHFYVNGTNNDNTLDFPITDTDPNFGCMNQVGEGTVPNQFGTWWFGRGGWCPGKQVPVVMTDITAQVTKGADNTFDYKGFHNGAVYNGDNWNHIRLSSWLVISK